MVNTEEGLKLYGASTEHIFRAKEFCFTILCRSKNSSKSIPWSAKQFSHHTGFKDTVRRVPWLKVSVYNNAFMMLFCFWLAFT